MRIGDWSSDVCSSDLHLLVNPHHVDLFEGTLRSNVDPTGRLNERALGLLLDASACADVVSLAPEGLDQPVTPAGATFSGGQRQRIALAPALAMDAPNLILHDPTPALDAVTSHRIAQVIPTPRTDGSSLITPLFLHTFPPLPSQRH